LGTLNYYTMKVNLLCVFLLLSFESFGQDKLPFPFSVITIQDLNFKYEKDSTAIAVIIREFGHAEIENSNDNNLLFTFHVKMKILKKEGLSLANIELQLDKQKEKIERLRKVTGSSYNLENGKIKETKFSPKNVFTESSKEYDLKKFALPNVQVGTVIEYEYQIESPFFVLNFWPWDFQNDLPKISSEYWAIVPANYRYNIALRGGLPLIKNESKVLKESFSPGGGLLADCVWYQWAMKNIPPFDEEDYMTSRENFVSAIRFELTQIDHFDGRKDKVTKEWTDVDLELSQYEKFGTQLRRGKEVVDQHIGGLLISEPDSLTRAQNIFQFVREWYVWNGNFGFYSEAGIKKAFEEKKGNVGDINLTLVAAFRYAGFSSDPIILSTRKHGITTDLFPVLSQFNYVVAKLTINNKTYLLDATEDFLPFGVLPERCLNGRGRVMAKPKSYWLEIKPTDRYRKITNMQLTMGQAGELSGVVTNTYSGYKAAEVREAVYSHSNPDDFMNEKRKGWSVGEINDFSFTNLSAVSKPLVETLQIKLEAIDLSKGNTFLLNPFIMDKISENPFKSAERTYPVDYGAPREEIQVITIDLPEIIDIDELPEKIGVALPNNGGRFIYEVKKEGKKVIINSSLVISRTTFSPTEYHFLKEFYNRAINAYGMDLMLKKKQG
jgi:hypothetical protein